MRDRTVEHQPTKIIGNKPITIGQGFSTLAWIPEEEGSWALPLLHERITSTETPIVKASSQPGGQKEPEAEEKGRLTV